MLDGILASLTAVASTTVLDCDTVGIANPNETTVNGAAVSSGSQTINGSNVFPTETIIDSNVITQEYGPANGSNIPYGLVDGNKIITKDAVESIMKAFEERDMKTCPLEEHELRLLEMLVVDGDSIQEHAAKILTSCLNKK